MNDSLDIINGWYALNSLNELTLLFVLRYSCKIFTNICTKLSCVGFKEQTTEELFKCVQIIFLHTHYRLTDRRRDSHKSVYVFFYKNRKNVYLFCYI